MSTQLALMSISEHSQMESVVLLTMPLGNTDNRGTTTSHC